MQRVVCPAGGHRLLEDEQPGILKGKQGASHLQCNPREPDSSETQFPHLSNGGVIFAQFTHSDNKSDSCQGSILQNRKTLCKYAMHNSTYVHVQPCGSSSLQTPRVETERERVGEGRGWIFGKKLPACLPFKTTAKFQSLIRRGLHVSVKLN